MSVGPKPRLSIHVKRWPHQESFLVKGSLRSVPHTHQRILLTATDASGTVLDRQIAIADGHGDYSAAFPISLPLARVSATYAGATYEEPAYAEATIR